MLNYYAKVLSPNLFFFPIRSKLKTPLVEIEGSLAFYSHCWFHKHISSTQTVFINKIKVVTMMRNN